MRAVSIMFTRDDDVLDVFVGVVCDVDVHFDGLAVVINLDTKSEKVNIYYCNILSFVFYRVNKLL